MRQPQMIDTYITQLRNDPSAVPPSGLDPELAAIVRETVLSAPRPTASANVKPKVWTHVLEVTQSAATAGHPDKSQRVERDAPAADHISDTVQLLSTRHLAPPRAFGRVWALPLAAALAVIVFVWALLPALVDNDNSDGPVSVFISPEERNRDVFTRYVDQAWNAGHTEVLYDVLTGEHIYHGPSLLKPAVGIQPMADLINTYRTAFPDWHFTIESATITDAEVWARLVGTGTHTRPFVDHEGTTLEPSGESVTLEVIVNARFDYGKIIEQQFEFDTSDLLHQIQPDAASEMSPAERRNVAVVQQLMEQMWIDPTAELFSETHQFGSRHCAPSGNHACQMVMDHEWLDWLEQFQAAFPDLGFRGNH